MGMQVRIYTGNNAEENYVLKCFFEGCDESDVCIVPLQEYEPSDVAIVFGTYKKNVPISYPRGNVVHRQREHGKDVVIVETGYINRGAGPNHHYAVGLNGLNGRADFKNKNSPDDRSAQFKEKLKPWRKTGTHVLVCGQVPWDASCDFIDWNDWSFNTVKELCALTDRPIIYRAHPLVKTATPFGAARSHNYWIQDDLKDCWCVVTFNSNSGVDAMLAGIPVVAMDQGSMVWGMETPLSQINSPVMLNRDQWLSNLCYAQWTPTEMKEGVVWKHLFGR